MLRMLVQSGIRPQRIASMQVIRHLQRQPTQNRLYTSDSKAEQQDATRQEDPALKTLFWTHLYKLDDRVADLGKELGAFELDVHKSISDLNTRMETGFARVDGRLSFIQWQIGIIGSAIAGFLGFAGYTLKRAVDVYFLQVATTVSPEGSNDGKNK